MAGEPAARIFKSKSFSRFAKRAGISDAKLVEAITRAERGLIDADLGGGVIKQRIAREGGGRSGGFRTIIFFRSKNRAFFVHGFAKSEKDNLQPEELSAFKEAAKIVLALSEHQLQQAIEAGSFVTVRQKEE